MMARSMPSRSSSRAARPPDTPASFPLRSCGAKAEARPVDKNDAMLRGETLAEGEIHVLEVGAGAVEKNDRRVCCIPATPQLDHVLAQAADLDKAAARQMRPLDQPRADECDDGAHA